MRLFFNRCHGETPASAEPWELPESFIYVHSKSVRRSNVSNVTHVPSNGRASSQNLLYDRENGSLRREPPNRSPRPCHKSRHVHCRCLAETANFNWFKGPLRAQPFAQRNFDCARLLWALLASLVASASCSVRVGAITEFTGHLPRHGQTTPLKFPSVTNCAFLGSSLQLRCYDFQLSSPSV